MKAIVASKNKEKMIEIVDKTYRKINDDEVLLDMKYCGVCHTDLHVAGQDYGDHSGIVLGHEGTGVVIKIGDKVKNIKVGDAVCVPWYYMSCGFCEYCVNGEETFCRNVLNSGFTVDGGMQAQCIMVGKYCTKIPKGYDLAKASSITCAGVTCYKALKEANTKPGQWVIISGVGGLGNLAVQYAKNVFGAHVIAVDLDDDKLKLAKEVGADVIINAKTTDVVKEVMKHTGIGADSVVVTAVSKAAFNTAIDSVKAKGKVIAVALPVDTMDVSIPRVVLDGIIIMGSLVGTRIDLKEALDFAAEGKVDPIVEIKGINDAAQIFDDMKNGKILGRHVIDLSTAK